MKLKDEVSQGSVRELQILCKADLAKLQRSTDQNTWQNELKDLFSFELYW